MMSSGLTIKTITRNLTNLEGIAVSMSEDQKVRYEKRQSQKVRNA
jgi:hypothetical protein